MKLFTALLTLSGLLIIEGTMLFAYPGGGQGRYRYNRANRGPCYMNGARSGYGLDRMKTDLKLTPDQVKKIEAINIKFRDKYFAQRGNHSAIIALHNDHRKAVENVLTAKQRKIFRSNPDYCLGPHNRGRNYHWR